jgi:hypothetical protein
VGNFTGCDCAGSAFALDSFISRCAHQTTFEGAKLANSEWRLPRQQVASAMNLIVAMF